MDFRVSIHLELERAHKSEHKHKAWEEKTEKCVTPFPPASGRLR